MENSPQTQEEINQRYTALAAELGAMEYNVTQGYPRRREIIYKEITELFALGDALNKGNRKDEPKGLQSGSDLADAAKKLPKRNKKNPSDAA